MRETDISNTFPLAFATKGQTVSLMAIHANDKLRKHLGELGLNIGMQVRVVQDGMNGPMILAVKNDARLAIGHATAQKIMVRHSESDK